MAEVPREGAVVLPHLLLDGGAAGRIGLIEIQGDEAVHMTGEDRGTPRERFEEIKPDSIRMGMAGANRQAEAEELTDGLPLGPLGSRPAFGGAGTGEIGSGAGERTGKALGGRIRGIDHPVALVGGRAPAAGLEGAAGERRQRIGVCRERRRNAAPGEGEEPAPVRKVSGEGAAAETRRIAREQGSPAGAGGRRIGGRGDSP